MISATSRKTKTEDRIASYVPRDVQGATALTFTDTRAQLFSIVYIISQASVHWPTFEDNLLYTTLSYSPLDGGGREEELVASIASQMIYPPIYDCVDCHHGPELDSYQMKVGKPASRQRDPPETHESGFAQLGCWVTMTLVWFQTLLSMASRETLRDQLKDYAAEGAQQRSPKGS